MNNGAQKVNDPEFHKSVQRFANTKLKICKGSSGVIE
jgi:hypothetical protein